jgi:hypothetical protein
MPLPDLRLRVVVPAVLGAFLLAFSFASVATAAKSNTVPGQLRVVNSKGRSLAQQTQFTGDGVSIKTDKKADCFGPGTGGSGKSVDVPGFTALGLVADAGTSERAVRPLGISDAFDFGVAVCGIGKAVSSQTGFWYLKVNHVASQVGGDQTTVAKGDEVLWYLIDDFNKPTPDELVLDAPTSAKAGGELKAKVVSYADDGTKSPAEGVDISGADGPTDAKGKTTIPADEPMIELTATRDGSIPSNTVFVCTQGPDTCPAGYATTTGGSKGDDRIDVADEATTVLAGAGDDRITATDGKYGDVINCGGGDDSVTVSKVLKKRSGFKGCERIKVVG